ncbi:hypothetical protein FB45DRAFT_924112 [Roridomyces roridus]|uniref:Uncharacterized protein n=1 Tax=Roridomyces roridus TaxID=1738132 RepID=A0AAD7BLZ1_9AGAR|nr:hypothetical protein FB45DRAFT_924112 [Roridomyces roridus]
MSFQRDTAVEMKGEGAVEEGGSAGCLTPRGGPPDEEDLLVIFLPPSYSPRHSASPHASRRHDTTGLTAHCLVFSIWAVVGMCRRAGGCRGFAGGVYRAPAIGIMSSSSVQTGRKARAWVDGGDASALSERVHGGIVVAGTLGLLADSYGRSVSRAFRRVLCVAPLIPTYLSRIRPRGEYFRDRQQKALREGGVARHHGADCGPGCADRDGT